jgi:galactofuranosylgalactofuranosylrhamnosyl-N-acetylglucosaminyl-diphospho-decaprenol beta-1,5/1,6-galactofuranosyltransferase
MFALLWQSLRRQRQLLGRFDDMRRVYRGALPVLSSKEKWETVLLSGPPAQENVSRNGRHRG